MPRIRLFSSSLLPVLLLAWGGAAQSDEVAESGAGTLATLFMEAWNTHDAAAFGRLMASDADWVTASGIRLRGRDGIQAYLADEHATWAKASTMRAMNIQVRALNRKTAVVSFEWEISTPADDGGPPSVARGNNLFVTLKEGGWTIVSGQVARKR
jgi:uncharacterized protein (TIGR02246 family)